LNFQINLPYSLSFCRFNTDLAFIQIGNLQDNEPDFTTAVQLNYLTIPLIVQLQLGNRIDLELGPQVGFLLNQVSKIKNFDGLDDNSLEERNSISGDFQLDYGLAAGIAIHIIDSFSITPRFYLGLRNRLNGAPGNLQNYNGALQFSVNYIF